MIDIGSRVIVIKDHRKIPLGTIGKVFWKKRYDYHYGTFGLIRIGIRTDSGETYFIDAHDTKEIGV